MFTMSLSNTTSSGFRVLLKTNVNTTKKINTEGRLYAICSSIYFGIILTIEKLFEMGVLRYYK